MKRTFALILALILCLAISGCGDEKPAETTAPENVKPTLFQHALTVTDGVFAPRQAAFGSTTEATLQSAGLSKDLLRDDGRIINTFSIPDFADEIKEIFTFQDDQLVSVEYVLIVPADQAEAIWKAMEEQAKEMIPEEFTGAVPPDGYSWMDSQENYIFMNRPEGGLEGQRILQLQLSMHRPK